LEFENNNDFSEAVGQILKLKDIREPYKGGRR